MSVASHLKTVKAETGRPLYLTARDALREAIDGGAFRPGERMPSTKVLSQQLRVSLVTAHRALQELVASGVVRRSQGKGTFVHDDARHRLTTNQIRLGVLMHPEASLAEYHHSQTIQGVRQEAREAGVDLVLPRFDEDIRNECQGYLLISPQVQQIDAMLEWAGNRPMLVAGAVPPSMSLNVSSIKVDNYDIGQRALDHLCGLGHRRIGYIGVDDNATCGRERWEGFLAGCFKHDCVPRDEHVIRSLGTHLDDRELMALVRMLNHDAPTALFAGGIDFAMDIYNTVIERGIRVPDQLSLIAVDDPLGASMLPPPLTTFHRPLIELGRMAVRTLLGMIAPGSPKHFQKTLLADLVVRRSTGRVR